ncbi:MAG: tetratricopeptide repeat protein [candidate division WOR-3 bacterium]
MKCPFLVRRKEIFDREGKKLGEEIEIKECIKNECMVYDGAAKLCSLLSTNIKNGIIIEDFKNGVKEIKEEMFQRTEAIGVILSTTVQTFQDALLNRFDLMKKQNEVIILGFDRLTELQNTLIETIKSQAEKNLNQLGALSNLGEKQIEELKTLKESYNNLTSTQQRMSEELRHYFEELKNNFNTVNEYINSRTEVLKNSLERLMTTYQAGAEAVNNTLERTHTLIQEIGKRFDAVENIGLGVNSLADLIKNELTGMKSEVVNSVNTISAQFGELKSAYWTGIQNQQEILNKTFGGFQDALNNQLENLKNTMLNFLQNQVESQQNLLKDLEGTIGFKLDELKVLFNEFAKLQQSSGEVFGSHLEKVGNNLTNRLDELASVIKSELGNLKNEFIGNISGMQNGFVSIAGTINELKESLTQRLGTIQETVKGVEVPLSELKNFLSSQLSSVVERLKDYEAPINELKEIIGNQFRALQESLKNYEGPLQALKDALAEQLITAQEGLKKYDELNNVLKGGIYNIGEFLNNTNQHYLNSLNNIQNAIVNLEGFFEKTQNNIANMSEMMTNLNRNYLESLGKIAGLAEGMRKGVELVGENIQESVKGLISAMKNEIGALEQQYEKTFSDIARLSERFGELNSRITAMTNEFQRQFKDLLEQQLEVSKFSSEVLKSLKEYFIKQEEQYKAEQAAKRKKDALDHFDRATLYYYRGNYELALNEIERALELDRLAEYLNLKGLILTELGRAEEAKDSFEEALKLEPNLAEIYNNFGLLYVKSKKLNEAVGMFQEAIKRNVNYALAYTHLGKVLLELERFEEAIAAFQRALEIDPTNREAQEAIELYQKGKLKT